MAPILVILTAALAAFPTAFAHPGHDVQHEAMERRDFMSVHPHSVRSCAAQLEARGHAGSSIRRRQAMGREARIKRGLSDSALFKRDSYNTSHESTEAFALGDDETLLFSDNSSCVLQPEVTEGPYYVDGELMRRNITDGQAGIPLYLDVQFVDTSTCEPVPAVFIDLWHSNSTGVYSGVNASGNGNSADASNIDQTFLRGVQETDFNGVVQYETIFPGHYDGRATHIHILAHNSNDTMIRTNGTLLEGNIPLTPRTLDSSSSIRISFLSCKPLHRTTPTLKP